MNGGGSTPALFTRQYGEGEPLILVHGLLATGEVFEPVIESFARRHRVIVPDMRGHGRSFRLPGPYTAERMAKDLAELLDAEGVESVGVLGYSQGGTVAQRFARDYPDRTRYLMLVCTYTSHHLSVRQRIENVLLLRMLERFGAGTVAWTIASIALTATRAGIRGRHPLPLDRARRIGEILASNDTERMIEATRAMTDFDSREWLGQIACPTLVVCGSRDLVAPRSRCEMLAKYIRGSQLCVVERQGHSLPWTDPEELVKLTERWLSSLP